MDNHHSLCKMSERRFVSIENDREERELLILQLFDMKGTISPQNALFGKSAVYERVLTSLIPRNVGQLAELGRSPLFIVSSYGNSGQHDRGEIP
jgi:hypothetical protein